jgi:hypothetical protein
MIEYAWQLSYARACVYVQYLSERTDACMHAGACACLPACRLIKYSTQYICVDPLACWSVDCQSTSGGLAVYVCM